MRRSGLLTSVICSLMLEVLCPAASTVWNAVNDFGIGSQPQNCWSYGWKWAGSLQDLDAFPSYYDVSDQYGPFGRWVEHYTAPGYTSAIYHNPQAAPIDTAFWHGSNNVRVNAGSLCFMISRFDAPTVRWTAPEGGRYHVAGGFWGADFIGPTNSTVYVVLNSSSIRYQQIVAGFGAAASYSETLTLKGGDTLDFVAAANSAVYPAHDSTGFDATITRLSAEVAHTVDNPVSYTDWINDCDVVKYNGEYYLTGNWMAGDIMSSHNLTDWGNRRHAFSYTNSWYTPSDPFNPDLDIHASHLRYDNGVFHLYAQLGELITHAVSNSIWGPYTEVDPIAAFAECIDADTFVDTDGSMHFYSTRFYNGNRIYRRPMANLWTLTGSYTAQIYPNETWYGTNYINEGSKVFKYRDRYYMLYNAYHTVSNDYSIGCVEAAGPTQFYNSGKYPLSVLTRTTPDLGGGEIRALGQSWIVDGLNGFEKWIGYFAEAEGVRHQCIDRVHFFNRTLFVDGPTNRYTTGYHPSPAKPQLRSLFNLPDGPMPAEDWMAISAGTWDISDGQGRQSEQNTFSFNLVNRDPAVHYLIEANVKFSGPADNEDKLGVVAYFADWTNWMIVGLDRSNDSWYCHKRQGGVDTVIGGSYAGSMNYGAYHKIRVEKNGASFTIRIDDKVPPGLSGPVTAGYTAVGLPGLYADHAAGTYDGVIYTIGWDEYGNTVQGWGNQPDGNPATGNWTYGSTGITQNSTSGTCYIYKGDFMPSYEFSTQVTKTGTANGAMGIGAAVIDSDNFLCVQIDMASHEVFTYGNRNGVALAQQRAPVAPKNSYNLRAVKLPNQVIVFVDGREMLRVHKSFGASQVCLITQNMSASYDGILLYRTEPKEPPAPWQSSDIGQVLFGGDADYNEGTYVLNGAGADIWHLNDEFHYASYEDAGDSHIVARIVSMDATDPWARAGVMFRSSLTDNAAMAMVNMCSNGNLQLIWRQDAGLGTGVFNLPAQTLPIYVKLVRSGAACTGYYSQDGQIWANLGTCTVLLGSNYRTGLAVTSHNSNRRCGAVFDRVSYPGWPLAAAPVEGDINGDRQVDFDDLAILCDQWLMGPENDADLWLDADNRVNLKDFSVLAENFTAAGQLLSALPAGQIQPQGWIKRHIEEDADNGWVHQVEVMSIDGDWWATPDYGRNAFYQPYVGRRDAHCQGEYQAHWLDNLVRMGWVGGIEDCHQLAQSGVDAILSSIPVSGYIGVVRPEYEFRFTTGEKSDYEIWAFGEHLSALLLHYRMENDPHVLNACTKAVDLFCRQYGPYSLNPRLPYGLWWGNMASVLSEMYLHTGDAKYRDTAEYVLDGALAHVGWQLDTVAGAEFITNHAAGLGIYYKAVLDVYRINRNPELRQWLTVVQDKLERQHLQPNGSPSGHGEHLCGTGPYVHMELCDPFWWSWNWTEMIKLTDEVRYADLAETAYFNAMPGARSKDARAAAYFTCHNQLTTSHRIGDGGLAYAVRQFWDCCHSNAPRMMPILLENMILVSPNNELSVAFYGPMTATANLGDGLQVSLKQQTHYPFEETVHITVDPVFAARFPVRLRIPGWCGNAQVNVNGVALDKSCPAGTWVTVERNWRAGDSIDITFPMDIKVDFCDVSTDVRYWIPDDEKAGTWAKAAVVRRGPLLYSLPVPAAVRTPLPTMGTQRGGFEEMAAVNGTWNYALQLTAVDPATSFEVITLPVEPDAAVWQQSSVALEVDAKRIPAWTCTEGDLIGKEDSPRLPERRWVAPSLPPEGFTVSDKTEKIRLVPYGFTTLRMTYLPYVQG